MNINAFKKCTRSERDDHRKSVSIQQPEQMKGKWAEVFQNDHPIHIEVGMGKGQFIIEMARRNPEVNYIGIEKYSSVLVRAVEKLEDFEQDNLRLIRMDAENIEEVFDKDEVDRIYLNFSDPCQKTAMQRED